MVRAELARSRAVRNTGEQMIVVKYQNGKKRRGVLLALGGQHIRVAMQDSADAAEYRLISGHWVSEDCELVTFEFSERGFETGNSHELPAILTGEFQAPAIQRIM
jgi:hypothetical protein